MLSAALPTTFTCAGESDRAESQHAIPRLTVLPQNERAVEEFST